MSLTQKQAFKVGFLQACAEDGLSLDETKQRVKQAIAHRRAGGQLEKQAWWPWLVNGASYLGGKALGAAGTLTNTALTAGAIGAVGAPLLAGAGTGYLAAKMNSSDGKGLMDDAKSEEIIGEYTRLAEEAKRRAAIKRMQASGKQVVALTPGE